MELGDTFEAKKPHPCGANRWKIVGTGADWKIRCLGCGRIVVLLPDELSKRIKRVLLKEA